MAASPQQPGGGWSHVPLAPQDQIPALAEEFKADADDHKVALCQGVYRSTDGSPYVLPSVREAERRVFERAQHHEYLSLVGLEGFTQASVSLCYGADRPAVRERRVAAIQSASGCAALRMAGEFVRRFRPDAAVYVSNPTWANHRKIFTDAGLAVREYRYLDTATMRLDVTGMLRDLADAPRGSSVVVQTCAHNPSGADPTLPQWDQIIDTCRRRGHTVVFDTAYQGFASGDTEADAQSLRRAADAGLSIIVCQSYSKNMGLYSERVGCWSIVCEDAAQAKAVQSQMCSIARGMISTAPAFGSRLVLEVLSDDTLRRQWLDECKAMAVRMRTERVRLRDELRKAGSTRLSADQCEELRRKHHIYVTSDGRISVAGVTATNVRYIARSIHDVVGNGAAPRSKL